MRSVLGLWHRWRVTLRGALAVIAALVTIAMFSADAAHAATTTVQAGQQNGGTAAVDQFNAATVIIHPADTVHWTWFSNAFGHTVTSFNQTGGVPDWQTPASLTGSGQSFDHTFSGGGVFTYFCSIHSLRSDADPINVDASIAAGKMVGKVIVATSVGGIAEEPRIAALAANDGSNSNWAPWASAVAGISVVVFGAGVIASLVRRSRRKSPL